MSTDELYSDAVISAVCNHMNADHVEDNLLIVRSLGGRPDATAARMATMSPSGAVFTATVGGDEVDVEVPWEGVPAERVDFRHEVVRMYHEACAALGVEPRQAGEH